MAEHRPEQGQTTEGPKPPMEPNFFHMIETFAVPAMVWTGLVPNPVDQKTDVNLELAEYQIGMLELLRTKTQGNLTADEEVFLDEMLHAVRLTFVRASEPAEKKGEEQRTKDEGQSGAAK